MLNIEHPGVTGIRSGICVADGCLIRNWLSVILALVKRPYYCPDNERFPNAARTA